MNLLLTEIVKYVQSVREECMETGVVPVSRTWDERRGPALDTWGSENMMRVGMPKGLVKEVRLAGL